MKKMTRQILACCAIAALCWFGMLILDKNSMQEELIRLHVVANSNNPADQALKLHVRNAVFHSLQTNLQNIGDVEQAKQYIETRLPQIRVIAEDALKAMGCDKTVEVHFSAESFDASYSDTLALPAGIYNALRIVIGNGDGKNWWGIIFPEVITLAKVQDKEQIPAGSFDDEIENTAMSEEEYNLRFGFMELIGKLENMVFSG